MSLLPEQLLINETGLPSAEMFWTLNTYLKRFEKNLIYYANWKVECIKFEDQFFVFLMKMRHNYPNFHFAYHFKCGTTTVSNIFLTLLYLIYDSIYTPYFNIHLVLRIKLACLNLSKNSQTVE